MAEIKNGDSPWYTRPPAWVVALLVAGGTGGVGMGAGGLRLHEQTQTQIEGLQKEIDELRADLATKGERVRLELATKAGTAERLELKADFENRLSAIDHHLAALEERFERWTDAVNAPRTPGPR
jgi:hypothetical protein